MRKPEEYSKQIQNSFKKAVMEKYGQVDGKRNQLTINNIVFDDLPEPDDYNRHKKILAENKSEGVNVYADVQLKEKTGKTIDSRKKMKIGFLPTTTNRHSFILNGKEYVPQIQRRLRPGVYTQYDRNGLAEAYFNLSKGKNMTLRYMPSKERMTVEIGNSNIPLYTFLKDVYKVPDTKLRETFGVKLHGTEAEKHMKDKTKELKRLHKLLLPHVEPPLHPDVSAENIRQKLDKTEMDPEITKMTLGKGFNKINPDSLITAAKEMMALHRGESEITGKDSLAYASIHSAEDFLHEKISKLAPQTQIRLKPKIDRAQKISQLLLPSVFNKQVDGFFINSDLVNYPPQVNPMEMLENSHKITSLGEGGVGSVEAMPPGARDVDESHPGYIDLVRTPDDMKAGIDTRVSMAAWKKGNSLRTVMMDKKGKPVEISPEEHHNKVVAIAGEKPILGNYYRGFKKGKMVEVAKDKIDYFINPNYMHTTSTATIPFLSNNMGQRNAMGAKMLGQALSLRDREAPLVSTEAAKLIDKAYIPKSKVSGTVTKILPGKIHIKDALGKVHIHNTPHNFSLNYHSYLDFTPNVGVGDKVSKNQLLGDHNFSKNGRMALGKNLNVAFLTMKGFNFEDGVVVTESGANKLKSNHIYHEEIEIPNESVVVNDKRFKTVYPNKYTIDQLKNVEDGIVKIGTVLHNGDPIITAVKRKREAPEALMVGKMTSTISNPYNDISVKWEKDYPGKVIDVHRSGKFIKVYIKSESPLQIGDKLCFDEETELLTDNGWIKYTEINPRTKICTLNKDNFIQYQNPDAIHIYPTGGRMYFIKNQQIDSLVTESHDQFVQLRGKAEFGKYKAKNIFGKRVRYKKNGNWIGQARGMMIFPELEVKAGQSGNGKRTIPEYKMPMFLYLMILGAYLSEGNIVNQPESGNYGIDITIGNERKKKEFVEGIREYDLKYNICSNGQKVRIYSKQLMTHFKQFGKAHEKYIPNEVFSLSNHQLVQLFYWMMWGDGHTTDKPVAYYTSSKRLANDFQRLCLHLSWAANINVREYEGYREVNGKTCWCHTSYRVGIITKKVTPQVNHGHTKKQIIQEEGFIENYTEPVWCVSVPNGVVYVRRNGKPYWSGNCNRYGNKGVVTHILKDDEAPRTKEGKIPDVIFNPAGIISRGNVSQIFETQLGKIAKKTGKPYFLKNFTGENIWQETEKEMKKHGIKYGSEYFDPKTGKQLKYFDHKAGKYKDPMDGNQYILKLAKQTETNFSARAGGSYDVDLRPLKGGEEGSKNVGGLDFYGILAHGGTRNILREAATYKAEYNPEVWQAIMQGKPLPTPKPTFAFNKMIGMLNGMGINVKKEGNHLKFLPFTDKDILKISNGEVKNSSLAMTKPDPETGLPFRPEKGGLFDPSVTGGLRGKNFSHIKLHKPIVNAVFEKPARELLDMTQKDFSALADGTSHINIGDKVLTGGEAIKHMLSQIDVDKSLQNYQDQFAKTRSIDKKDRLIKKIKYLNTLKKNNYRPEEAYILHHLPVIPPIYRPIYPNQEGKTVVSDANRLYKDIVNFNDEMKSPLLNAVSQSNPLYVNTHKGYYESIKKLQGFDGTSEQMNFGEREATGFLKTIIGSNPKHGYFQSKLTSRVQDLAGRGTIIPDPALGIDECALPEPMAWKLYGKFVAGKMVRQGYTVDKALTEIEKKTPFAKNVLLSEMRERPVMLNRAPTLHKFSIMGFKPQLTPGKSIKIAPLITKGFNADFDGDSMTVHVPLSSEAIKETFTMLPSNNLYSVLDKSPMHTPSQESVYGLNVITTPINSKPEHHFKTKEEAIKAYHQGRIKINEKITIG